LNVHPTTSITGAVLPSSFALVFTWSVVCNHRHNLFRSQYKQAGVPLELHCERTRSYFPYFCARHKLEIWGSVAALSQDPPTNYQCANCNFSCLRRFPCANNSPEIDS
jgi:hypothetical protein